jgi:hypothetical protein
LQHKYQSALRSREVQQKQLVSAAECYYIVQHAMSTLCGDLEARNGLWSGNSLQRHSGFYRSVSYCDLTLELDLLLTQYCATQCNGDWFLNLLAERALHGAAVLSYSSTPCHSEAEQMSSLFESMALLLVWLLQDDRLVTLNDERHQRDALRSWAFSYFLSDAFIGAHLVPFPRRACVSTLPYTDSIISLCISQLCTVDNYEGVVKPKHSLWQTDFDYAYVLMVADQSEVEQVLERYLSEAGSAEERADAVGRGVTVDTVWPVMRVPSTEQLRDFPTSVRPSNLLRCSSFYAVLFAMLTHATDVGVTNRNVGKLTMLAVHLVRLALAYQEYEQTSEQSSDSDSRVTIVDNVDELALDSWYPVEVCQNVYASVLHTIGTVNMRGQADRRVSVNQSILTLLVRAYEAYTQQDYVAPNSASAAAAAAATATATVKLKLKLKRHQLFATGADVIGALLDTLCCKSKSISKWFSKGRESGLAGARVLNSESNNANVGDRTTVATSSTATTDGQSVSPPSRLLRNWKLIKRL